MSRFNTELSDAARYPFTCIVATRYGDLDTNRHINNVAFTQGLEEGRTRFGAAFGLHCRRQWTVPISPVIAKRLKNFMLLKARERQGSER